MTNWRRCASACSTNCKLEADRNESVVRSRLFGPGMPLADIERLTPQNFLVAQLTPRLRFSGRDFSRVDWLEAVGDSGGMVQMVGKLLPPKDMGEVKVPVMVSIVPWGKDWKAAMPLELQAQIDDLRTGRVTARGVPAAAVAATTPATTATAPSTAPAAPKTSASPQGIVELFDDAEKNIREKRCDDYFRKQMSPNWRRTTGAKAQRSLIQTCENPRNLARADDHGPATGARRHAALRIPGHAGHLRSNQPGAAVSGNGGGAGRQALVYRRVTARVVNCPRAA